MEQPVLIRRSPKGLWAQITTIGVLALLLFIFISWLISLLFGWTASQGAGLKSLTFIFFLGAWLVTSFKLWGDWKIKRYEITPDSIIVHAKAGQWGSAQTIYRYESIISVKMTQGFWGKKFNFGDVRLTIPKLDGDVVMNDIENPIEQLSELQKRMGERSAGTHNLIT